MAKCSICGAETILYTNGVPICVDCDKSDEGSSAGSTWRTESGTLSHHPGQMGARLFDQREKGDDS